MRTVRAYAIADAVLYALVVAGGAFAGAIGINAVLIRWSWFGVELVLFFCGWILLAYGTALAWPRSPWSVEHDNGKVRIAREDADAPYASDVDTGGLLERTLSRVVPPEKLPVTDRFSPGTKLLVGGVLTLACSYLVEVLLVSSS